jgi:hypothetical protein
MANRTVVAKNHEAVTAGHRLVGEQDMLPVDVGRIQLISSLHQDGPSGQLPKQQHQALPRRIEVLRKQAPPLLFPQSGSSR